MRTDMDQSPPAGTRWTKRRLSLAACVCLILLAAALRFHDLPGDSVGTEEVLFANNSRGTIGETLSRTRAGRSAPMLYPTLLWGVQKVERSATSIRFLPALASTLTVAAIVLLLPVAGVPRATALLAGLLATLSDAAIQHAQDAREYSLDTLLAVVMLFAALRALNGGKARILLPLSLFVAPLLQYGLALWGAALLAAMLALYWKRRAAETGSAFASLTEASRFTAVPAAALGAGALVTWLLTLRYQETGWAIDSYLAGSYYGASYYGTSFANVPGMLDFVATATLNLLDYHLLDAFGGIAVAAALLAFALNRGFRTHPLTVFFIAALAVTAVAALLDLYPLGGSRQCLWLGPAIFLLFAHALRSAADGVSARGIPTWAPRAGLAVAVLAVAIAGAAKTTSATGPYGAPRITWRVLDILDERERAGDAVYLHASETTLVEFYRTPVPANYHFLGCGYRRGGQDCTSWVLDLMEAETRRLWLVAPHQVEGIVDVVRYRLGVLDGFAFREVLAQDIPRRRDEVEREYALYLVENVHRAPERVKGHDEIGPIILEGLGAAAIARHPYEVHSSGPWLTYVNRQCDGENIGGLPRVFLHVYPVDADDLPDRRKDDGFDNLDFRFDNHSVYRGGPCIAVRGLPDYPIARIHTGQFTSVRGDRETIWAGAFDGEGAPLPIP